MNRIAFYLEENEMLALLLVLELEGVIAIIAGLLTAAGGLAGLAAYWKPYRSRFLPNPGGPSIATSPDDLSPALAGVFYRGSISWSVALATLLDLAQKGVIRIEQVGSKNQSGPGEFTIQRQPGEYALRPHEQGLLHVLFNARNSGQAGIQTSEMN